MLGRPEISRVTRTRAEAEATYDRISRWYDLVQGRWERRSRDAALRMLAAVEGETVLEIGFGTGHAVVALARSVGPQGKVSGIDLSRRMLSITQERVNQAGLSPRVELRQGDALSLPYGEESFDAIFLSFVLELFDTPEIPAVLGECSRVLRPGGRLSVASLTRSVGEIRMVRLYEWGHRRLPKLLDCRPIYVRRALEAAGFEARESAHLTFLGLPVEIVLALNPR